MKTILTKSLSGRLLLWSAWLVSALLFASRCAAAPPAHPRLKHSKSIKKALALVETGATKPGPCAADRARGSHGEVSRYQIRLKLWRRHTRSRHYASPTLAWTVAKQILARRIEWFRKDTHREPSAFDLYVMWNAPGYYASVRFRPYWVRRSIARRAQRFANLVEDFNRRLYRVDGQDSRESARASLLSAGAPERQGSGAPSFD